MVNEKEIEENGQQNKMPRLDPTCFKPDERAAIEKYVREMIIYREMKLKYRLM
jgi:hypothetical protein